MTEKYLDIKSSNYSNDGFTMRIVYTESLGVIRITTIQFNCTSANYSGTYYPGGTISIDGEVILEMDYTASATHAFSTGYAGTTFVDMYSIGNATDPTKLPAKKITNKANVAIEVNVELYRSGISNKPKFINSTDVPLTIGLVYIDDGTGFAPYEVYVDDGERWVRCIPYVDDGTQWVLCC